VVELQIKQSVMVFVRCKLLTRVLEISQFLQRWKLWRRLALQAITYISGEPAASILIVPIYRLLGRVKQVKHSRYRPGVAQTVPA